MIKNLAMSKRHRASSILATGRILGLSMGTVMGIAFGVSGTASAQAPEPGTSFRDCDDCPEIIVVPAGSFLMGSGLDDAARLASEEPHHQVTIAAPFAIGIYEVTFEQWDACVAQGGCDNYSPRDQGHGRGRQPVINVHFGDAENYLAWLSETTGQTYRLPSEAEWEYAARAGTTTPSSYGTDLTSADDANVLRVAPGQTAHAALLNVSSEGRTVPVGSYAPNPWGLYDVHGNVAEFTADCWNRDYDGAPADGSARAVGDCEERAFRGGSWVTAPHTSRSAFRDNNPQLRFIDQGFRVLRELE
jgi:formylglycine-generating enzyme required for sulfatase activity